MYDLAVGSDGWKASGRPTERTGAHAHVATAADLAQQGLPVCAPDATVADVRHAIGQGPWELCAVTSSGKPDGVLLGVVRADATEVDPAAPVEDLLLPDPSTTRPDTTAKELAAEFDERRLTYLVVTAHDGHLIGLVRPADVQRWQA